MAMRFLPRHGRSAALWLAAVVGACGPSPFLVLAADPRLAAGGDMVDPPVRSPRRSHIQSVGEIVAATSEADLDLGLRLTRASTVLRQQLALARGAGLVVDEVAPGSRAARAGFKQHDVLVMLDDQLLLLPEQLAALLEAAPADAPLQCTVLRGGRKIAVPLTVTVPAARGGAITGPATGLRPTASALAIARGAGPLPRQVPARREASAPPGRLTRLSSETLLRQDADFQIRLTGGEETRLVVTDSQGRVVFNDAIDTPEARSRMPVVVRQRVEEMERSLEQRPAAPAAEIGRLDVAPIEIR